jgi:glycosyltransferase involved in cell wall biosynthesis
MKIDLYSTMHNEEEILPYFLRHYEQIADRIFVWEDQSTDRTREILASHPKVKLMPLNVHGDDDAHWVDNVWPQYTSISKGKADYVIIVDADEFVYHPNLYAYLETCLKDGVRLFCCCGFTMISESFPTTDEQIYDEIKTGMHDPWGGKCCVFSPYIHIKYAPGRHFTKECSEDLTQAGKHDLKLLHYRYLGKEYFAKRSARNMNRMSENNKIQHWDKAEKPDSKSPYSLYWYERWKHLATKVI